jgi:hypothetical protein
MRLLVVLALAALIAFFIWLLDEERRGDAWLFWPLVGVIAFRALWWVVEWAHYARPKFDCFQPVRREWKVDVLTTACPGEPRGMILRTLVAMKAIRYPHTDYLCDEGDDPVLREACRELGIVHVTRAVKRDAKAGNINNALAQATGEIAVVLDPDHEPSPYLLERTLGYFEDAGVGFVQSVQSYRNAHESLVADGAAKQTYLFYGPLMIGMNAYGTTQAIGANCVFRRSALDTIGGHAAGLAEDMHTTMQLYARGWRSVYVPEVLTRGLVPSTLPAYCKQQVKWACGAMELLLHEYPRLFHGFTWWQRLHYALAPLYFWRGFIGLVNIVVPIICLVWGGIGLRIDLVSYLAAYGPVLVLAAVIRQRTQRWSIEARERGSHFIGGLLGAGCWWTFMQGVLCALFQRKVPYIPTPKDNDAEDCWGLALPNLAAAALSIAAAVWGVSRDWTPFTFLMAGFALWNAAQLGFIALIGQQRTLEKVAWAFARQDWLGRLYARIEGEALRVYCTLRDTLRERGPTVALPVVLATLAFVLWPKAPLPKDPGEEWKETGGFYAGVHYLAADEGDFPASFVRRSRELGTEFRLFPLAQDWGAPFPRAALLEARRRGAVPLLTWRPAAASCAEILRGRFDEYLRGYAATVRAFGEPLLIRLALVPDGDEPREFIDAWTYVCAIFSDAGASNVGWVWQAPRRAEDFAAHFPGKAFVDWIGFTALNHGTTGGGEWREFADLYRALRPAVLEHRLPVLVTDFGSTEAGGSRAAWLARGLEAIAIRFPEIRGLVLSGRRRGWFADESTEVTEVLANGLAHEKLRPPEWWEKRERALWTERRRAPYRSPHLAGAPGNVTLLADGQPFYIRGVAYNPGHDWRDGNIPLTRRELEADLTSVRALGANTIRRYGRGVWDRNIFNLAGEHDLLVLYGFWFEHHVDYLTDEKKRAKYEADVEKSVRAWRDRPALLAWGLGNETWGLLKHHFAQPYLTEVRHAHIDFVEKLARRVHELDPRHPVYVAHEHSPHLAGTLADFARGAPGLDFTAVNSYYEARISTLHRIAGEFDPARPYLISEFGPDGYWDSRFTRRDRHGALLEPSSDAKAATYERGWTAHVVPHRGANLGGVAYCWRDRFEATATWFGLTDPDGHPKPAYAALQKLWRGAAPPAGPRIVALDASGDTAAPGATLEVRAQATSTAGRPLRYRWRLATEEFEFEVGRLRPAPDGTVKVTLPKKTGAYRLYVTVTDGHTADEANMPIAVRAPDRPAVRPTLATHP